VKTKSGRADKWRRTAARQRGRHSAGQIDPSALRWEKRSF